MTFSKGGQPIVLGVLMMAWGCGGGPVNTVKTKEDAAKIAAAITAAQVSAGAGGEAACTSGGTVKAETSVGGDILKGEVTTTVKYSFSGCVSQGVTLNGSVSQVTNLASSAASFTTSGNVDTSLGSCIVDTRTDASSTAVTGNYCGFDVTSF
jgi:hypothetical protein